MGVNVMDFRIKSVGNVPPEHIPTPVMSHVRLVMKGNILVPARHHAQIVRQDNPLLLVHPPQHHATFFLVILENIVKEEHAHLVRLENTNIQVEFKHAQIVPLEHILKVE